MYRGSADKSSSGQSIRLPAPYGDPDRSALAAMGIVELVLHSSDILRAHDIDYHAPEEVVEPCLARIFPQCRPRQ